MSHPARTYMDPRLPGTLRALREAQGWSYRRLAAKASISPAYVYGIENAEKTNPTVQVIEALDTALEARGALLAMIREAPTASLPEDRDRIIYAAQHPTTLDRHAVEALAVVLAEHRRLDDFVEARFLLPSEVTYHEMVQKLAKEARGPAADALRLVAAQGTQYLGWLLAEARHDTPATATLQQAITEAEALGDGKLAAQARNFRGYVERQRGNPAGTAQWFEDAYRTPGATRLQRIGDAAQAAQGFALLGDHRKARELLGEAQSLALKADKDQAPGFAYWLSVTFGRLNLGIAYLALGDAAEAVEQLSAGLSGIPQHHQTAEWAAEYHRALKRAKEST